MTAPYRPQTKPLHRLHIVPPIPIRRSWQIDRLAWSDFAWLLLVILSLWLLGWQMARFLEGR